MEDWNDLLQPKLEGRIAWTDSPREFVGAALQTLRMHFNSTAADLKAAGISEADLADAVARLRKQVVVLKLCLRSEHCLSLQQCYDMRTGMGQIGVFPVPAHHAPPIYVLRELVFCTL